MKAVFSVVSIIGLLEILAGVLLIARPDFYRKTLGFFTKGKMMYLAGVVKIAFGVVFLVFARSCVRPWIVITLGLLTLAGGISCYVIRIEKLKRYIGWWQGRSDILLRSLGVVALAIGGVIVWAGMPVLP